jgi:hypothetical protein
MGDTPIFGKGSSKPFTVQGMEPHNTFLYIHVAYGGICAWTYLTWIIFLGWKTGRILWGRWKELGNSIEILALLGMFLASQQVLPFAPDNYGNILALAVLEKNLWIRRLTAEENN